ILDYILSSAQGSLVYRGASAWTVLAPGTSGQLLATQGAAANPQWITASGTGTVTSVSAGQGMTASPSPITGSGSIPMDHGSTAAAASVNLLDTSLIPGLPLDSDGNPYLHLISGDTLTFSALVTVTTAKKITIHVIGVDF